MQAKSVYKVPDGKLIKVSLDFNGKINSIKILGDFFVYPETWIEGLEKELVNTELNREIMEKKIIAFAANNKAELFGITPEALCEAIMRCKNEV